MYNYNPILLPPLVLQVYIGARVIPQKFFYDIVYLSIKITL